VSAPTLFALPERGVLAVTGSDRARWLDGMVTNEVKSLAPGGLRHALALTREGRIVAEVWVLARADALLLELERAAIPALTAHLEKFIVADDVTLRDASAEWARFALEGAGAAALAEGAIVADYSLAGGEGVQILAPAAEATALRDRLLAKGAVSGTPEELEVLRIEAGVPRQGRELTLEVLPAEARLDRAVSETKGCFTGQEVVTRMRSRDRVSHLLVALRFEGRAPAPGTELRLANRAVGNITSTAHSPRLGPIGLGYVRRADAVAGTKLEADAVPTEVVALPRT
jgi:folate-binding protein YgfZ